MTRSYPTVIPHLQYIFRVNCGITFYYHACVTEFKKIRELSPYIICEVVFKPERLIKLAEIKSQMISMLNKKKEQLYLVITTKMN